MILERLTNREKTLLFATVTIVFIAVFYGLIIDPIVNKWSRLNRQISQRTLKLNKNLAILQNEDWIKEEFIKYSEYAMPLGSDEETIAVLLKAIERIARKTSVHITNIRPRASKETELYKEFGFEVISEASLEGLLRFMYELQNAAELLRVKRSTLSLKAGKGKTLRAVFEISKLAVKTP